MREIDISRLGRRRVLLPEVVLCREDYARRGWSRSAVEEFARMVRRRVPWHTPLVVDRELHLLDGWRRYEAYRLAYPSDWHRVEVEVAVLECDPSERLLWSARLNRVHGERLSDEEAADVAARYALRLGCEGVLALKREARRLSRLLAVEPRLVLGRLFGPVEPARPGRTPGFAPRPPLLFDPGGFTVEGFREHCAWVADAAGVVGRRAMEDPLAEAEARRAFAALLGLLRERDAAAAS